MPRTVDLFLDSDQPLDRVAEQLGELSSARFVTSPDQAHFVAHEGGVVAYLTDHDFLDDDDLPLSEFRYVLSASVAKGASLEDSPELSFLRRVNAGLRQSGAFASLLVIDLERPDSVPGDTQ
ncbi:MAG: hypothetical protein ACLQVK_20305 [Acidimicrobiales bacterium]|jgi:hypothetical protein